MLANIIIVLFAVVLFVFFVFYKKDALLRIFSLDASQSTKMLKEQLQQTANDIIRQLENRVSHLEYLLEEAEQKIVLLEEKIELAENIVKVQDSAAIIAPNILPPPAQVAAAYKQNDNSASPPPLEEELVQPVRLQEKSKESRHIPDIKEITNGDKRRVIAAMAEQGYNVTEIAKATGKGKGEIMLVLQLNKR